MKRAYNIYYNGHLQNVVGGLKAGRFYSHTPSRAIRRAKRNTYRERVNNKIKTGFCVAMLAITSYACYSNSKVEPLKIEPVRSSYNEAFPREFESRDLPLYYTDERLVSIANANPKEYAELAVNATFEGNEWSSFNELIHNESSWIVGNVNAKSGACGLGQAYPCSKYTGGLGNAKSEIDWAISYIKGRYQTPTNALNFWNSHNPHWY